MYWRISGELLRLPSGYREDMDIWIAPSNENKIAFLNTLHCMGYTEPETDYIKDEDFSTYFMCPLGIRPHVIDVLTIVNKNISFDEAEKNKVVHMTEAGINMNLVSYGFLKDIKLRPSGQKDLWDIARLEELRNIK